MVAREDLIDNELRQIADRLCDGSLVPVLNQLIRRTKLSRAERTELEQLLAAHSKRSNKG